MKVIEEGRSQLGERREGGEGCVIVMRVMHASLMSSFTGLRSVLYCWINSVHDTEGVSFSRM